MDYPNLKQRTVTAALLVGALCLLLVFASLACVFRVLLYGAALLAIGGAAWEFSMFAAPRSSNRLLRSAYMLISLAAPSAVVLHTVANYSCSGLPAQAVVASVMAGFVASFLLGVSLLVWSGRHSLDEARRTAQEVFLALILLGFCGASLLGLTTLMGSPRLLTWLILVVCSNDIAAYFCGVTLGGPKLAAALSPSKTVSGAVCGLLVGSGFGYLLYEYLLTQQAGLSGFIFSCAIVLAAQLGDLSKSYLKRLHQVKDSGQLLPGHGGILDRIDGILCAAPLLLACLANR